MDEAAEDVVVYFAHPAPHRVKLHSTNRLSRLNEEGKQGATGWASSPTRRASLEQNEAWQLQYRYLRDATLLWEAVKQKDWANIARYYNGPNYRKYGYDIKLKAAYEAYRKKTG